MIALSLIFCINVPRTKTRPMYLLLESQKLELANTENNAFVALGNNTFVSSLKESDTRRKSPKF